MKRSELRTENDYLPEHHRYRDEGCELAPSCLHCPLPRCIYDEPGGKQERRRRRRNEEIQRLFDSQRKDIDELAQRYGVSRRTIYRILRRAAHD